MMAAVRAVLTSATLEAGAEIARGREESVQKPQESTEERSTEYVSPALTCKTETYLLISRCHPEAVCTIRRRYRQYLLL